MASSTRPSWAKPLPQSTRSSVLEYRFPKPFDQYVLTGRSRAAWHTSFIIPQLDIVLDAGLCVNSVRPRHIFLTHGHSDHTLLAPAFASREALPDFYCPREMVDVFDDYLLARTMLNLGGLIGYEDAEDAGIAPQGEDARLHSHSDRDRSQGEASWLNTHKTHGLLPGEEFTLHQKQGIDVLTFACDHSVPCLGYLFKSTTHKLRPQYAGLKGDELRALKKSGTEITAPHTVPIFAFLGDTTASILAADPPWLRDGVAVVITECSFLYEEHRAQAEKTKHTFWPDLKPIIERWPQTTFVLTHFSMRYTDKMIAQFFQDLEDCPSNIVVWVDEEAGDTEVDSAALKRQSNLRPP